MANRTRRADPSRHPADVVRLLPQTPTGIRWHRDAWVAKRGIGVAGAIEKRSFSVGTLGIEPAWHRAVAWQRGEFVPRQFEGMDLSRKEKRKFTLHRRSLGPGDGSGWMYELSIERSKGCKGPWLRVNLGSSETLTQKRIDAAVATLNLRMDLFREGVSRGQNREYLFLKMAKVEAEKAPRQKRLKLKDVVGWTGEGEGVKFAAFPLVLVRPAKEMRGAVGLRPERFARGP